jgi:hypothetical protein
MRMRIKHNKVDVSISKLSKVVSSLRAEEETRGNGRGPCTAFKLDPATKTRWVMTSEMWFCTKPPLCTFTILFTIDLIENILQKRQHGQHVPEAMQQQHIPEALVLVFLRALLAFVPCHASSRKKYGVLVLGIGARRAATRARFGFAGVLPR